METSLFRKFIDIIRKDNITENITFSFGNYDDSHLRPGPSFLELSLKTKMEFFVDIFLYERRFEKIMIVEDKIIKYDDNLVENIKELDDLSLTLIYGRDILDKEIIKRINKEFLNETDSKINLEDFKDFINV